jgi:hypothetical protein
MTAHRVIIPEQSYSILEFEQDELPGIAAVNTALRGFEPKVVFAWHLSVMLQLEELAQNGMPTMAERDVVNRFAESLDSAIKGKDSSKPNALFLARITWNATFELIWRVFDPELADHYLRSLINDVPAVRPRAFDHRMTEDPTWELTRWHLADRETSS